MEYSEEEMNTLREYSGAGGKESVGATGRGLLDEYYTPMEVVDTMWDIVENMIPEAKSVLEPTV